MAKAKIPANKNAPKNEKKKTEQADPNMPLFFKRPSPLDVNRHGKAGLEMQESLAFASDTNSVMINAVEFIEAAKSYPIVFSANENNPMPAIITGLEQKNYFIEKNGTWKKNHYIPAYVRRYPFTFMEIAEEGKFVLCVDEASPHFREKAGKGVQPFYTKDAKPSDLSVNALNFCSAFQSQYIATRTFCAALQAAGLLTPTRSEITLANGRKIDLAGFQIIDEEKFSKLTDVQILDFHKKGWLPLIYFVLLSASNWRHLIALASEKSKA